MLTKSVWTKCVWTKCVWTKSVLTKWRRAGGRGGGEGGGGGIQNQKQEPHTKLWGKRSRSAGMTSSKRKASLEELPSGEPT